MTNWKTELTSGGETLGTVKIERGIFQGDSLSPLLFVMIMIPLSMILEKMCTKCGYAMQKRGKVINHLLFMDDLKLYSKDRNQLDSLVNTVRVYSEDIRMEFGIEKCAVFEMREGRSVDSVGIELPGGEVMKVVEEEGYKYLGILQLDAVLNKKMKE